MSPSTPNPPFPALPHSLRRSRRFLCFLCVISFAASPFPRSGCLTPVPSRRSRPLISHIGAFSFRGCRHSAAVNVFLFSAVSFPFPSPPLPFFPPLSTSFPRLVAAPIFMCPYSRTRRTRIRIVAHSPAHPSIRPSSNVRDPGHQPSTRMHA